MTTTIRTPITILYTSADASPQSGAFRCLLDMAEQGLGAGYRPILALSKEPGGPLGGAEALRTYVMRLPRLRRGRSAPRYAMDLVDTARAALRLARIARRERVDVVHVNEILDVYGAVAARLAGVPCVWHVRADMSSWPSPLRAALPRVANALADRIIAVSRSVREEVFERQGVSARKVRVIHDPGPDLRGLHLGADGPAVRQELRVPDHGSLIVQVSKLVAPKGHEILLRAAPKVLASFPDARFAIVGGEEAGMHHHRYAERLRALPAELGIEGAVTFTGYRNDVARVMAAADVVVHSPTHPDPFPNVVLQAMAVGTTVVAADVGGAREQVEHDVSGLLVPMGDPDALADAISRLLADPEERARLATAGVTRVRFSFSAEAFYGRLFELYDEMRRA